MRSIIPWATAGLVLAAGALARGESVQGIYLEARSTCGWPSAVAEKPQQAVLAWQVREGGYEGVDLAGHAIVAIVTADPSSCGAPTQAQLLVDDRATPPQREALVQLARSLAPEALAASGPARPAKLDVRIGEGCARGCGVIDCQLVKIRTRRVEASDENAVAGGEQAAPLARVFSTDPAFTVSYVSTGEGAIEVHDVASALTGSFSR